ncbi:MAG: acetyltransferase [Bacteroidetes bacterium]|nr:acetyltransferase [Bacteroidota bacterium]
MKDDIAIIGGGGLAREILTLINATQNWQAIGFYDDRLDKATLSKKLSVLGAIDDLVRQNKNCNAVLAIGDVLAKAKIIRQLIPNPRIQYPVLVHPLAILQDVSSIQIGSGAIVTAGCILTADISIGEHVLINLACTIGHGTQIGSGCSIMPGVNIAGEVVIGNEVLIGSGANILSGVKIGNGARVGSGAVVTKDVKANSTVIGIPARETQSSK